MLNVLHTPAGVDNIRACCVYQPAQLAVSLMCMWCRIKQNAGNGTVWVLFAQRLPAKMQGAGGALMNWIDPAMCVAGACYTCCYIRHALVMHGRRINLAVLVLLAPDASGVSYHHEQHAEGAMSGCALLALHLHGSNSARYSTAAGLLSCGWLLSVNETALPNQYVSAGKQLGCKQTAAALMLHICWAVFDSVVGPMCAGQRRESTRGGFGLGCELPCMYV
jgi:hypothetical protein